MGMIKKWYRQLVCDHIWGDPIRDEYDDYKRGEQVIVVFFSRTCVLCEKGKTTDMFLINGD